MKIFIIYASECREQVNGLRKKISDNSDKNTILRMNSNEKNKKKSSKCSWHEEAEKMIELADMIVYIISDSSSKNPNVEWEIYKCREHDKYVVCLDMRKKSDEYAKEEILEYSLLKNESELLKIIDQYNNDEYIDLFNNRKDKETMLEQYKIFFNTAENLVDRRQKVNSFYISANTALITVGCTIITLGGNENLLPKLFIIFLLSLPGYFINRSWKMMLESYCINHKAKMKILSMMDKELAVSLYDAEWQAMKNKYNKGKYVRFTDSEIILPKAFKIFYIIIDIIVFLIVMIILVAKLTNFKFTIFQ